MVKVLNITISDRNFIFCLAYFFVRASVHVYFDILSPVIFMIHVICLSHNYSTAVCFATSFHQAMKPILSIVYEQCGT